MQGKEIFSEINTDEYDKGLLSEQPVIIPVIEETYTIDKIIKETGKIKVKKEVTTNYETAAIQLMRDEFEIKHIVKNELIEEAPKVRQEGNVLIIPVVKEVMIKKLLLVEEVHIIKDSVAVAEQLNIPLRKEKVTVTRTEITG